MKIIPFNPNVSSYQELSVNLGEFVCDFRFLWNERDGFWYVDLKSSNGSVLGCRLCVGSNLVDKTSKLGYDGNFRVLKVTKTTKNLGFENFGVDYKLVYGLSSEWELIDGI